LIAFTSSGSLSASVPAVLEITSTKSSKSLSPFNAFSSKMSLFTVFDSNGVEVFEIGMLTLDFSFKNLDLLTGLELL